MATTGDKPGVGLYKCKRCGETIRLDDIKGNLVRNFGEESLFIIKDVGKLSNTNLNNLSSEINVVTNQTKRGAL